MRKNADDLQKILIFFLSKVKVKVKFNFETNGKTVM